MDSKTSAAPIWATRAPYIEPHHGPEKYPRLRTEFTKIQVAPNGCWLWFGDNVKTAHVLLYELLNDPLETGSTLEPLCNTVGCVCPFHMREAKASRGVSDWSYRMMMTTKDRIEVNPKKPSVVKTSKPRPKSEPIEEVLSLPVVAVPEPVVVPKPVIMKVVKASPVVKAPPVVKASIAKPVPIKVAVEVPTCLRGHPQTPDNQYVYPNGKRKECLTCKRLRGAKRKG